MARFLLVLLPALALTLACPNAIAAGFNLSWNDCGSHGASLETFACSTNAGYHDLIVSVVVSNDMPQAVGIEAVVFLSVGQGEVLPDWWFLAPSQCRAGAISLVTDVAADPTTCPSVFGSNQAFGGVAWDSQYLGSPDLARLRFIAAIPDPGVAISAGIEYTVGRLRISNAGTTTCGGCSMPACIYVSEVRVYQPAGVGDAFLHGPASQADVGWQCPTTLTTGGCFINPGCATSTTHPTWGSIKSLYR